MDKPDNVGQLDGNGNKGSWMPRPNIPDLRQYHPWCYQIRDTPTIEHITDSLKAHYWYGNNGNLLDQCENFYYTYWGRF
jgi:hypothetical protein